MQFIKANSFEEWRTACRALLARDVPPSDVVFQDTDRSPSLFDTDDAVQSLPLSSTQPPSSQQSPVVHRIPKSFLQAAERIACHTASDRWERLYRVLWRMTHGEPRLLDVTTDDDVHHLTLLEQAVRRDAHKMKAFVRFRKLVSTEGDHFVAWHRPDYRIVQLTAPFFSRRFPSMHWTILTPTESAHWDLTELHYGPGAAASDAPEGDELEDLWKTYYGSIFNPARIKLKMMTQEMPTRHWPTLPETDIIPDLLADAPRRVAEMIARQEGFATSAADFLPESLTFDDLRSAAAGCEGCNLHSPATQTVFGEGPVDSKLMLIGEQPGDQEDLAGHPFVGPAGEVLDQALRRAGIDREDIYVTNSVKHFKYEPEGKRRLHSKPNAREIAACKPWVEAEITLVKPKVIVCLGATSGQQIMGPEFKVTKDRGQLRSTSYSESTIGTWHPSAILRHPSERRREEMLSQLVDDLRFAAKLIAADSDGHNSPEP